MHLKRAPSMLSEHSVVRISIPITYVRRASNHRIRLKGSNNVGHRRRTRPGTLCYLDHFEPGGLASILNSAMSFRSRILFIFTSNIRAMIKTLSTASLQLYPGFVYLPYRGNCRCPVLDRPGRSLVCFVSATGY